MTAHLNAHQAAESSAGDGIIIDIRGFREFDILHAAGSISVEYSRRSFPERLLEVVPAHLPVVLIVDDTVKGDDCISQLTDSGRTVLGWLTVHEWVDAGLPTSNLEEIDTDEMRARIKSGVPLLDIREQIEWEFLGIIPEAVRIPLGELASRVDEVSAMVKDDQGLVILCSAGLRSATAAAVLARHGFSKMSHSPEGLNGWLRAGLPVAKLSEA